MVTPHVAISGAGPAGLLCAIFLCRLGIPVTVLEKSLVADPWSSKSYTINLNGRGLAALEYAGILSEAQSMGLARRRFLMESFDGKQQTIPRDPPVYGFTRPKLVQCLENFLQTNYSDRVTIHRGVAVKDVKINCRDDDGSTLTCEVMLDNGSTVACTHVIAADGKWSAVRNAVPDFAGKFTVQTEPAWGISITPCISPERWDRDALNAFRPQNPKYYIIAAPLPGEAKPYSISVICFDEIQHDHPWMLARGDQDSQSDWDEYGARTAASETDKAFQEQLSNLLEQDLPLFHKDILGKKSFHDVRINRRVSWLKATSENPKYCDGSGRIILLGDAAHAMTPAIGEGCNCALESALSLAKSLVDDEKEQALEKITVENLTRAFIDYGTKRPFQVIPFQERSAAGNRYKQSEPSNTK